MQTASVRRRSASRVFLNVLGKLLVSPLGTLLAAVLIFMLQTSNRRDDWMFPTGVFLIGVSVVWLALWAYRTSPRSTAPSIYAPVATAVPAPAAICSPASAVTTFSPPIKSPPETALTPAELWKVRLARYLGALLPLSILFLKLFSSRTGAAAGSLVELAFAILIIPVVAVWLVGSPWLPSIILWGAAGALGARHVPNAEIPWFRWKARTVRGGLFEGLLSVPLAMVALFLLQALSETPPPRAPSTSPSASLGSSFNPPSASGSPQSLLSRRPNPVSPSLPGRLETGIRSAANARETSQFWREVILSPFRSDRSCCAEPSPIAPNLRITPFLVERKGVIEQDLGSFQPVPTAGVDPELVTFHRAVTKHLGDLRDAIDRMMPELASPHRLFSAQELFQAASDPANSLHNELSPPLRAGALEFLRTAERSVELRRRLHALRTTLSTRYPSEKFLDP
jgi:hypothetical protein